MAQVYSFVDDNGVTRLFAEIHPDPAGTPFNGGTITNGLNITPDVAAPQTPPLFISDATVQSGTVLQARDANNENVLTVTTTGASLGGSSGNPPLVQTSAAVGMRLWGDSQNDSTAGIRIEAGPTLGFYGHAPAAKPTVAGAKLPSDVVLQSLLAGLVALGLITDNST